MARLFDTGIFSVNATNGSVGVGYKLNFYVTGLSTRKNTYPTRADALAGTNANANPVVSDGGGRFPPIWLVGGDYKVVMTDADGGGPVTRDPADSGDIDASAIDVRSFGAATDSTANQTTAIVAAFAAALTSGVGRVEGGGGTYYASQAAVTVAGALIVDNMTLKEYAPNAGSPQTITFTAQTAGTGSLYLGPNFKVDRSGDGTVGDLGNSWAICVDGVARVEAHCEIYGNAKGNGLWVKSAKWFYDNSYVHDMLCSHSGISDDIQHGSYAWACENVETRGVVERLGSLDRTSVYRDRYSRGRAYSGCRNLLIGGTVGPGVDQCYDITGDLRNGNSNVKLDGAHALYAYSGGFKFANSVQGMILGPATVIEPGLAGVLLSGPATSLTNMTNGAMVSGIVQTGGGSNQFWAGDGVSVVRIARQGVGSPENAYPNNVRITGNTLKQFGGPTTFTVADTDELTPSLTVPLNAWKCARVRLTTTGTLPTGLATATDYWISQNDSGNFQLATSFNNCQDDVFITGLTGGSGTHTITIQNDCLYGAVNEVLVYNKTAPNLVYRNNFGPVTAKHANFKDLRASFTNSSAQSIPNNSGTFVDADAEVDPYGIGVFGSGYIEITIPFEGDWEFVVNGDWAGGTASGQQLTKLKMDTGSGFAEITGYTAKDPCPTVEQSQSISWRGYLQRNTLIRVEVTQGSGSSKNYQLREFHVAYLP